MRELFVTCKICAPADAAESALYADLGNPHVFNIERAFMPNSIHVAFSNHLGVKRKYCFSVTDPALRAKWGNLLPRQVALTRQHFALIPDSPTSRPRQAAEAVALHVLRDALIPPPEDPKLKPRIERTGSVSIAYEAMVNGEEASLGPLQATKPGNPSDGVDGMVEVQTGKELVLVCRQNSLLPGMLELLQAGMGPKVARNGGRV